MYAQPYVGYATCLLEQGQRVEARDQLELAVRRAPRDVHARVQFAIVEGTILGNVQRAEEICRAVVSMAPDNPEALSCVERSAGRSR